MLLSYFGHTSVGNCAKVVLTRDPGGRSLMTGSVAAMLTVVALYSLWVFSVAPPSPPPGCGPNPDTALVPLAEEAGRAASDRRLHLRVPRGRDGHRPPVPGSLQPRRGAVGRPRAGPGAPGLGLIGAIFLLAELLIITQSASFAGSIGIVGALTGPLMGGVFPMLMMESSRRRGDYEPALFWRWMGHRSSPCFVFLAFMATEVIYVWLWPTRPSSGSSRRPSSSSSLVITVVMLRSGAMRPRAVIEVRRDEESGRDPIQVVTRGRTVRAEQLPPGDRIVDVPLAPLDVNEVRAWAHRGRRRRRVRGAGVKAVLRGPGGDVPQEMRDGAVVLEVGDDPETLELRLPKVSPGGRR